jgi:hypothetical protein
LNLEEVKQFLDDNKDSDEVKAYVKELKTVSKEDVEGFLDTDEGKKLLQPKLDQNFTKGLATWKEKNLDKLVEDKYQEKHPSETEEQKRLRTLEQELEKERKARTRESIKNKAISVANEKKLPTGMIDYLIGEDEETTLSNLQKYEETVNDVATKAAEGKIKGRSPNPNPKPPVTQKNPWKPGEINLTEQARILKEDPQLAEKFKSNA